MLVAQSCLTLCDPMDYSSPGSSVHEIVQARILDWAAMPSSRGSSWPREQTWSPATAGGFFATHTTWEAPTSGKMKVKAAQSRLTLCNPMDYIVHGILQTRILEWGAIPFSRGSSQSTDWTQVSHTAGGSFTSWATKEVQGCINLYRQRGKVPQGRSLCVIIIAKTMKTKVKVKETDTSWSQNWFFPATQSRVWFFLVVIYRCESWIIKKAEHQRIDAF